MNNKLKHLIAMGILLALSACSLPQTLDDSGTPVVAGAGTQDAGEALHNELVVGMLRQKQYYAALAHVQEQENQSGATPELRYLEAEARRQLNQDKAAEQLYKGLLRGPFAADSYHGLGLMYAKTDLNSAVQQLREAVKRRPTDAQMRNDLGYALTMAGHYSEALPELATAVELDPEDSQGLNNLIVLLMVTHDEAGVKRVASQGGVSAEALAALRKQAQALARPRR